MDVDQPQIDFVIPAYNAQDTILRTLGSLQDQSDPRWRAIVIDDGSVDSTAKIVGEFSDPRVQCYSQLNAGPSAARNFGSGIGGSPLVCFLDADDTVHKDFVDRMTPIALGAVLGSSCGYDYKGVQGNTLCAVPPMGEHRFESASLLNLDPPAIMSMVYRRSALDELQKTGPLFDESLCAYEDWDMLDRLVRDHISQDVLFGRCDSVLASYWCTPSSLSASMDMVWQNGCALIESRCETKESSKQVAANWGIGILGGCILTEDHDTAGRIMHALGALGSSDVWVMVQALRWHTMRRFGVPLCEVDLMQDVIISRCDLVLQDPLLVGAIKECYENSGSVRIKRLLARAVEMVREERDGRVVIYGLGRNGMLVVELADELGIGVVLVDDQQESGVVDPRRVQADSIGQSDVVIVTPVESESIVRSLRRVDADRILTVHSSAWVAESL